MAPTRRADRDHSIVDPGDGLARGPRRYVRRLTGDASAYDCRFVEWLDRVEIDGRPFEFAAHQDDLTAPKGPPAVTLTATAADLITARMGSSAAERKAALRRMKFEGHDAVAAMRTAFRLAGDPGLLVGAWRT